MRTPENSPGPAERPAEVDPRFALMDHSMGYLFSAALRAVAALGVADHLTEGPRPVAELARAVDADPGKVIVDLLMMSSFTGRERTRAEFGSLFARAGFRLERVIPTGTRLSIVEGVPA